MVKNYCALQNVMVACKRKVAISSDLWSHTWNVSEVLTYFSKQFPKENKNVWVTVNWLCQFPNFTEDQMFGISLHPQNNPRDDPHLELFLAKSMVSLMSILVTYWTNALIQLLTWINGHVDSFISRMHMNKCGFLMLSLENLSSTHNRLP